ncbi:glutaredoxin family protein [Peribacillus saganii]|uniref:Glutaredoxin family protein n=1 Tax=Peribacillus saganii TaxID=2303992 RepID=A0A372LK86_9BACI|nr:glutaredoxin family protein [Peribacillus saganii]RFU66997.1 glutaredoxin family protein [Peribacillus saganii]
MDELILYTREKCPLCDKAKELLDGEFSFREVDIHSDDALIEKYGLMIPVLEYRGEAIQYGNLDLKDLRNRLMDV